MIWGFINAIMGYQGGFIYSLLGAIVFSLYIVFDTYLITQKYSYDDAILASISLYLDILNLFLFILRLLTIRRDD